MSAEDVNTNMDNPKRHNIGGSMNRPIRNDDPLSPRNVLGRDYGKPIEVEMSSFRYDVADILTDIEKMLFEKNRKYGNSALEPTRIFSKANATEQIMVRLDDKLSRIANRQDDEDEDVIDDLIGYLILLKISLRSN